MVNIHDTIEYLVHQVVDSVHSSFPDHYDKSDTESTLWVWVYENKNTVEDLLLNNERWEGPLRHLMTKAGNKFLRKEDEATYGYSQDDVSAYSTKVIKTLLPNIFSYEDWQSFGLHGDGQPTAKGQVNETGDVIAAMIDIKTAVEKLRDPQRDIILWVYKYHYTMQNLADALDVPLGTAKTRHSAALKALQRSIGDKPLSEMRKGYTGRSAPGTAESLAITERDYEG